MKLNSLRSQLETHEGGKASFINAEQELRRSVMACMLWEDTFYEDGIEIAERIAKEIPKVKAEVCKDIAIEARNKMKLRHVPLLIVREMARCDTNRRCVSDTLYEIIQRPDELGEFLSIYWKNGKEPISKQVKVGLAKAFTKYNEYQLAKYNRDYTIKLRDVLFLIHAKPLNEDQAKLWKKLINNELQTPDTWEVGLSAGKNKKEVFEKLIKNNKLGGLAFLRNLRNMRDSNIEEEIIKRGFESINFDKVLPFRFISAAIMVPEYEKLLDNKLVELLKNKEKLEGKTAIVIDVSGSMENVLSEKSIISRMDAACSLAIILNEQCDDCDIYSFSSNVKYIPRRSGMALRDAIIHSQPHSSTYLGQALHTIIGKKYNRIVCITDEQAHDDIPSFVGRGYIINVASYKNGIGYNKWIHINGFSEATVNYIINYENG